MTNIQYHLKFNWSQGKLRSSTLYDKIRYVRRNLCCVIKYSCLQTRQQKNLKFLSFSLSIFSWNQNFAEIYYVFCVFCGSYGVCLAIRFPPYIWNSRIYKKCTCCCTSWKKISQKCLHKKSKFQMIKFSIIIFCYTMLIVWAVCKIIWVTFSISFQMNDSLLLQ